MGQVKTSAAMIPKLKGVYTLNPTRSVMKSDGRERLLAVTSDVKGFKKVQPPKAMKRKTK